MTRTGHFSPEARSTDEALVRRVPLARLADEALERTVAERAAAEAETRGVKTQVRFRR